MEPSAPPPLPRPFVLKAAIVVGWLWFGLSFLAVLWDPWAVLFAIPAGIGALGLQDNKAWAGYGLALWQSTFLGVVTLRTILNGPQTTPWESLIPGFIVLLSMAGLMLMAGRAAEIYRGGLAGSPWGWLALASVTSAFFLIFAPFSIPTGAMEKTLLIGDRVLVRRTPGRAPRQGDIVVFHYPVNRRQIFIKRVVAMPGQRLRIVNKQVLVNGQPLAEPHAVHLTTYVDSYRDNFPSEPNLRLFPGAQAMLKDHVANNEVVVPPGKYFVMGDNRDISLDSRYWGFIEAADIIGQPVLVYYSFEQRPDEPVESPPPTLFRARWSRFLKLL